MLIHSFYWPLPFIIGLIILLTGIVVLIKDPSRRVNQFFFLVAIMSSAWASANSMVILNWYVTTAQVFWDRITFVIGFLIAPAFAVFSCYLPEQKAPPKWLLASSVAISLAVIIIPFAGDLLQGQISEPHNANRIYLATYSVCFMGFVVYGLRNVFTKFRTAKNPFEKRQLKTLYTGLALAFPIGIVSGTIVPIIIEESWV